MHGCEFIVIIDIRAHERDQFGFEVVRSGKLGLVRLHMGNL